MKFKVVNDKMEYQKLKPPLSERTMAGLLELRDLYTAPMSLDTIALYPELALSGLVECIDEIIRLRNALLDCDKAR